MVKIEVTFINNENKLIDWNDRAAVGWFEYIKSPSTIFDFVIKIKSYDFSAYAISLKSLLMDLMINHRLLFRERGFNFFVSETPFFTIVNKTESLNIAFYNKLKERVDLDISVSDLDYALQLAICDGMSLFKMVAPETLSVLFSEVCQDLLSANRADFIEN